MITKVHSSSYKNIFNNLLIWLDNFINNFKKLDNLQSKAKFMIISNYYQIR